MKSLREIMDSNPAVQAIIEDPSLSNASAAQKISALIGEQRSSESVRKLRKSMGFQRSSHPARHDAQLPEPEIGTGKATVDEDGGEFVNVVLDAPIMGDNFDHVFELFNLDPELYDIIDNTVRMSTWQQSKRLDSGDRDTVQLYSYSCRFRRVRAVAEDDSDFETRRQRVFDWQPTDVLKASSDEPGTTFVVNWADWQLGKSEAGGVAATIDRVLESFQKTVTRVEELRACGRNIEGIAIVNMGDPLEGCIGNYASQTFTVELTQREQLLLGMDLFETGILTLSQLAAKVDVIGVLCNHGEWNRVDGKSITSDSDNAGGFLLDAVKRVVSARPDMGHINWTIPNDEMVVSKNLSGAVNAFTHGHKIPSGTLKSEEGWLQNQSIGLLRRDGVEPVIWTTAHKHHAFIYDFGPWHRIQCSALDGGSKWYTDASGKWSTPGTTTYLVGTHTSRRFSDYEIV
jgi:hypothetical protein